MENPCKNCLVRPICITNCKKLEDFIDKFVASFDNSMPIGYLSEFWIKKAEYRPGIKIHMKNDKEVWSSGR